MTPPTFQPWLDRVNLIRAWSAIFGLVFVGAMLTSRGMPWDGALARGLVAAAACYFLGWASSLWICGELYRGQIRRMQRAIQAQQYAQYEDMQQMYGLRQPETPGRREAA